MNDAELADRLFVLYGLITGPETQEDLDVNELVERNVRFALKVMQQLLVLRPQIRALIIEYVNAATENGDSE